MWHYVHDKHTTQKMVNFSGSALERTKGFILPMVLIFLMIFSMLAITALTLSQLEMRMAHNMTVINKQFNSLEAGLQFAEQMLLSTPNIDCLIQPRTKPWQATQLCQFTVNNITGRYVIEQFTESANTVVAEKTTDEIIIFKKALYYRITAWFDQDKNYSRALQSTLIKAGQPCKEGGKQVMVGPSSWRVLEM